MAVTATFKADFSDFTEKVTKAEKDLKSFETSTTKVGSSVSTMGKQAESSLSKMTSALGPLAGALGVTFSVAAVVNFTKAIIASSEELVKLSAKTGISTEGLQRLQIVGEAAGTTIDRMTAAITAMQTRLVSGSSHEALKAIGLDVDYIKSLNPDQQFIAIGNAIAGMEDPMKRTAAAYAIGGKAMVEQIPVMLEGFQKAEDATLIVTERATRAWAQFANDSSVIVKRFTATIARDFGEMIATVQENYKRLGEITDDIHVQIGRVAAKPLPAPAEMDLKGWGPKGAPDLTNQVQEMKDLVDVSEKHAAVMKKQEDAAKKYAEALASVTSYGGDFHTQLQALNGDTVAAVKYYAQAGASLSQLATVYGLTDAQVRAIGADLKFQETVITQNSKAWANVSTSIANAEARLVTFREAAYGVNADLTLMSDGISRMGAAGVVMGQGMTDGAAMIDAAVGRNKSTIGDFLSKMTGDFKNFAATGLAGVIGMFTGEGGIAGAATSMAKTVTAQVLGLIPLAGPILSQLAGPIIDGFKKIGGALKDLFGGPNADELAGRQVVDKFQANLASMLNETQKVEAGNTQWKATVIAIRDAYLANGLSAEEAMADAQRLWGATGEGAAASQAAVELVNQKMKGFTDQTNSAIDQARGLADALHDVGRAADNIHFPSGSATVGVPGYATGTGGRFVNFGQGTLALLHGRERVMTEGEQPGPDPAMLGALQGIRRDLQRQPELIALQLRAALAQV